MASSAPPRPPAAASLLLLLLLLACVVSTWGLSRSNSETDLELPKDFGENFVKEGDSRGPGGLDPRSSPPRRVHFGELDGSSELVTWVAEGLAPPSPTTTTTKTKEPRRFSGASGSGSKRTRLKVRRKHRHRHREGHRRRNRNKAAYVHRKAMQTDLLEAGIAEVFRGVAYGRSASVPPTTVDLEATHLLGSHRPTTRSSRNSSDDDAPKVNEEDEEEEAEDPPPDEMVDEVKIRSADVDYRNDREADVAPVALENVSGNDTATDVDLQTSNSTDTSVPKTKFVDEVTTVAPEAPREEGETSTVRNVEEPTEGENTHPNDSTTPVATPMNSTGVAITPTPTPSDSDDNKLENLTKNTTTSTTPSAGKNCSDWHTREGAGMSFVYIFEAIFFLLALLSLWRLVTLQACTFLLPRTYFVCIHLLLFTTTAFRAVYVFHLAYRGRDSLPPALLLLLLDTSLPCLLSALCVLLLAILKVLRDKIAPALNPVPHRVGVFLASLIAWSVTCDMIVGSVHDVMALLILTRVIILTFAVTAGLAFLVKYSRVRSELSRMMTENRRDMKLLMAPLVDARARRRTARPQQIASLATMCRCMIVIIVLMFLLCALNIYILAVITTPSLVHLKSWWALSGCTWVVEACLVGLLIVAAALTQGTYSRDKLIYVLLVPSICTRPENGKPARTNNNNNCAYQRVSYSSYTDSSQKTPVLEVSDPESSSRDREQYSTVVVPGPPTVRRSATFHCAPSRPIPPRIHGAYLSRPHPPSRIASSLTRIPSCPARTSSSMLVNDGGFVRFRTQVDVERPLGDRPRRHPSHSSIASYKEPSRPEAQYLPSQEPTGPVLPPLSRGSSPYGSRASLSQQSTHSLYAPRQQVESPMHGETPYADARTMRMGYPEGNCNSVYGAYPAMVHRSPSHRYTNLRRNNSFANHHQTTSSQGSYEHYNSLPGRRRYSKRHRLQSTHGHPQPYYEAGNHAAPPPPAYGTANDRYTTRDIRMLTSAGNYTAYPPYPGAAQRPYPPPQQQQYLQSHDAYRGYIHEYPQQGIPDHHPIHPDLVGSSYGREPHHGERQQLGEVGRERRGDKDTEWAIELIKSSPILAEFYAIKEEREKEEREKEEREKEERDLEEKRRQERKNREMRDNVCDGSEKT